MMKTTQAAVLLTALLAGSAFAVTPEENAERLNQHEERIDTLTDAHNEAGKQLEAFVKHVEESFDTVTDNLNTLDKEKADKADLDEVKEVVADNYETLNNHHETLEDHAERIEELQDSVEELQDGVNALAEETLFITGELVPNLDRKYHNALVKKQAQIDENKAAIEENKTAIDELKEVVADNYATLNNHDEVLNDHADKIEKLQEHKADKADIAANKERVANVEKYVGNLEKEMKHGFAAQAALAGLFQPYNVGKVNVTAAVGGYKSKAALAVGAGYRYNEHFAAKAGIAFSNKGGAAYNVGVNYEF